MRTYSIANGHNGSHYFISVEGKNAPRIETERYNGFTTVDYPNRDALARLFRNWRRDPNITIRRWR